MEHAYTRVALRVRGEISGGGSSEFLGRTSRDRSGIVDDDGGGGRDREKGGRFLKKYTEYARIFAKLALDLSLLKLIGVFIRSIEIFKIFLLSFF